MNIKIIYFPLLFVLLVSSFFFKDSLCFPSSSAGKESTCNARDPGSIFRSGRSPGEGKGYPLQYSWASLVAQMVKNLPAVQRPRFNPWVWEDPLEEGMETHSSILAWRIPMDRGAWRAIVHEVTKSQTRLSSHRVDSNGDSYIPYTEIILLKSYIRMMHLLPLMN